MANLSELIPNSASQSNLISISEADHRKRDSRTVDTDHDISAKERSVSKPSLFQAYLDTCPHDMSEIVEDITIGNTLDTEFGNKSATKIDDDSENCKREQNKKRKAPETPLEKEITPLEQNKLTNRLSYFNQLYDASSLEPLLLEDGAKTFKCSCCKKSEKCVVIFKVSFKVKSRVSMNAIGNQENQKNGRICIGCYEYLLRKQYDLFELIPNPTSQSNLTSKLETDQRPVSKPSLYQAYLDTYKNNKNKNKK